MKTLLSCFLLIARLASAQFENPAFVAALTAPAASLPQDVLIDWDFTQMAAGYQTVTNKAVGSDPSYLNFINSPAGPWNGSDNSHMPKIWTMSQATDNFTNAPDGSMTATRVVLGAGSSYLPGYRALGITAGSYTLSVYLKANGATNVPIRIGYTRGGSPAYSPDLTVTPSWQRFSFSFNTNAIQAVFWAANATTGDAFDISFWGPQLEAGASASTFYPSTNFNFKFGLGQFADDYDPLKSPTNCISFDSGGIRFGFGTGYAVLTNVSVYQVFRKTNTIPQVNAWLMTCGAQLDQMLFYSDNPIALDSEFSFRDSRAPTASPICDTNWHCLAGTYDGRSICMYLDGARIATNGISGFGFTTNQVATNTIVGIGATSSTTYGMQVAAFRMYTNAHSFSQAQAVYSDLQTKCASAGILLTNLQRIMAYEGDSITAQIIGGGLPHYPGIVGTNCTPNVFGPVFAVAGNTMTDLIARAPIVDGYILPGKSNVLSVLIGANSLGGLSFSDVTNYVVNTVKPYCQARRAAGWALVLGTVLPRTTLGDITIPDPTFCTNRNIVNLLYKADSSFYDALADYASNPTIGPDWACTNRTYYDTQGVHPTTVSHAIMAPILYNAVTNLLGVH